MAAEAAAVVCCFEKCQIDGCKCEKNGNDTNLSTMWLTFYYYIIEAGRCTFGDRKKNCRTVFVYSSVGILRECFFVAHSGVSALQLNTSECYDNIVWFICRRLSHSISMMFNIILNVYTHRTVTKCTTTAASAAPERVSLQSQSQLLIVDYEIELYSFS